MAEEEGMMVEGLEEDMEEEEGVVREEGRVEDMEVEEVMAGNRQSPFESRNNTRVSILQSFFFFIAVAPGK
jgi:hypothetical protein